MALLGTFYQLYLQREHNEKSLKPLVQIDLMDRGELIYVHIQNNGVGPMIIERLTFTKGSKICYDIADCLELDPKSYQHIPITDTVKKVLQPGGYHEVFSTRFEQAKTDEDLMHIRIQLSRLHLAVEGRDIYNNRITAERNLSWFARHLTSEHTILEIAN